MAQEAVSGTGGDLGQNQVGQRGEPLFVGDVCFGFAALFVGEVEIFESLFVATCRNGFLEFGCEFFLFRDGVYDCFLAFPQRFVIGMADV